MDMLTSTVSSYRPFNSSAAALDVDVVVLGGDTTTAIAVAAVAEFNGKVVLAYSAQGAELSNKVRYPSHPQLISSSFLDILYTHGSASRSLFPRPCS
jgi:hypothetical protein